MNDLMRNKVFSNLYLMLIALSILELTVATSYFAVMAVCRDNFLLFL